MKYFQLLLSDSNKLWKNYKNFKTDFYHKETGAIIKIEMLSEYENNHFPIIIKTLVDKLIPNKGRIPNFSSLGTKDIFINEKVIDIAEFNFIGLNLIPITDEDTNDIYYILYFKETIDCADWDKSDYERWKDNIPPFFWSNPRGNWFHKPILLIEKIPNHLDGFLLKDWGGGFNFIITERLKEKLASLETSKDFLIFEELVCM